MQTNGRKTAAPSRLIGYARLSSEEQAPIRTFEEQPRSVTTLKLSDGSPP